MNKVKIRNGDNLEETKMEQRKATNATRSKKRAKARVRAKRRKLTMLAISAMAVLATAFIVWYTADKAEAQQTQPVGYTSYEIQPGDTLWKIAGKYRPEEKDIREFIFDIIEINDLHSSRIQAGYHLIVPVYDPALFNAQNN